MENFFDEQIEILAEKSAANYIHVKPGTYVARCVSLIELGTQTDDFQGKGKTTRKKIILGWELPTELHEFSEEKGLQPYTVNRTYSLSMHEKSELRKNIDSWLGGLRKEEIPFNVAKLLDKPCLINMVKVEGETDPDNPKTKVGTVTSLSRGQECPPRVNPISVLTFQRWDEELFNRQPAWIRERIEKSPEFKKVKRDEQFAPGSMEGKWLKDDLSNL